MAGNIRPPPTTRTPVTRMFGFHVNTIPPCLCGSSIVRYVAGLRLADSGRVLLM